MFWETKEAEYGVNSVLPLTSCVTSRRGLHLSVPLFPYLQNGDGTVSYFHRAAVGRNMGWSRKALGQYFFEVGWLLSLEGEF